MSSQNNGLHIPTWVAQWLAAALLMYVMAWGIWTTAKVNANVEATAIIRTAQEENIDAIKSDISDIKTDQREIRNILREMDKKE